MPIHERVLGPCDALPKGFFVCKCPLHTLELRRNMINVEVVPVVAHAPEHCACPLDRLQLQWWAQTHLSRALILNCATFIILLPDNTPWKNKNNDVKSNLIKL